MLHNVDLILTLSGGLTAALALGFITQKLRMSPLVGYLLAGIIVGPYSPGFVADADTAAQCAEIGIILLMFGVGLHFHLKDLLAVQRIVLPGAAVQISAATLLGMVVSHGFGWSWTAGAVFGMAISVASTVVLTRVLSDNKALHTTTGHVALGWLVVEDLFTILLLVLLPAAVGSGLLPVFATPQMIALMENAAVDATQASLEEGQGTVGTRLDVSHDAATPVGMQVWAEAEVTAVDGRKLTFAVTAYDEAGPIGKGTHERFIIQNDKFLAKAQGKKKGN